MVIDYSKKFGYVHFFWEPKLAPNFQLFSKLASSFLFSQEHCVNVSKLAPIIYFLPKLASIIWWKVLVWTQKHKQSATVEQNKIAGCCFEGGQGMIIRCYFMLQWDIFADDQRSPTVWLSRLFIWITQILDVAMYNITDWDIIISLENAFDPQVY